MLRDVNAPAKKALQFSKIPVFAITLLHDKLTTKGTLLLFRLLKSFDHNFPKKVFPRKLKNQL